MTRRDHLDIFTSPPAFILFVIVLMAIWAAGLLGGSFLIGLMHQPEIVTPDEAGAR